MRHPSASELRKGDIIKLHKLRGEYKVTKVVGSNTIECYGPLPGTGGTVMVPKMRTFIEERISYLIREAEEPKGGT